MAVDFRGHPMFPSTGFNGDGHVSRFHFQGGSVYRNHYTDDLSVKSIDRSTANTHLYWHGGKLLVLKEDALPRVVHPHTLETEGMWDFNGKYTAASMSAQPKIDPVGREMIAYGYQT